MRLPDGSPIELMRGGMSCTEDEKSGEMMLTQCAISTYPLLRGIEKERNLLLTAEDNLNIGERPPPVFPRKYPSSLASLAKSPLDTKTPLHRANQLVNARRAGGIDVL